MLAIAIVAMAGLAFWLNRTKSGRAVRAVAHNRETAELLGVNSQLVFSICFFVAGWPRRRGRHLRGGVGGSGVLLIG
ncbi:hypothetical protein ACFSTC_20240 [Nonomuraea ferruginea]